MVFRSVFKIAMKNLFLVGRAIGMLECGRSLSFVARHLGVSRTSVRRWQSEFTRTGGIQRRKSSGRPKATSLRSDRLLMRTANLNRFSSCPALLRLWGENVSCMTLRRRLRTAGFRQYRCPLKPFLSPENRIARYHWCQNHVFWPLQRFRRVIWSDESRFRLMVNDGRVRVWRQRGERYRQDLVQRTLQAGAGSVHVWGAIWHGGRSALQILLQSVNGESYCQILEEFLEDDERLPNEGWTLQHDNAPAHRSAIVQDFLAERQIVPIQWPSRSPDLNPIENVWDFLGKKAQEQNPQSLRDLAEIIEVEWDLIPQEFLNTLVDSMPRRIGAVIQVNGGTTKY